MDSIRVTAKTVEDALTEASITLGTSRDNLEYTVIDKGSSGFFGIGGRKAVIEARRKFTEEDLMKEVFGDKEEKPKKEFTREAKREKKEQKESAKPEKTDREEKTDKTARFSEKKQEKKAEKPVKTEKPEKSVKSEKSGNMEKSGSAEKAGNTEKTGKAGKEANSQEERPAKKEHRKETRREPKKQRPSGREEDQAEEGTKPVKNLPKAKPDQSAEKEAQNGQEEPAKTPRVPADPEEAKRRAKVFLEDVFHSMEMQVEIHTEFEDDTLSVDISGEDMGVLIGKRGQTLDSLQYLTSLVVNRGKASYVRVKLDTEDYRNRRKATLENLARNIAFKVKKTRRPVFLEPMNPYERRIIHSALQNDPYVTTHSEGEEPFRKVVVTLKKERSRGGRYADRADRSFHTGNRTETEE